MPGTGEDYSLNVSDRLRLVFFLRQEDYIFGHVHFETTASFLRLRVLYEDI